MKIIVQRTRETSVSITGTLSVDSQFECFTLEPARTNPVNAGHPCMPAGTYPVTFSVSPHLGYRTPELENVPDRTDIRIHIGNWAKDTLGCILVGQGLAANWISGSKEAFAQLMTLLKTATDPITITILDPPATV